MNDSRRHSIWGEIEGSETDGYYVEGWSRLAGWFCISPNTWNEVFDQLRALGFEDNDIFAAREKSKAAKFMERYGVGDLKKAMENDQ